MVPIQLDDLFCVWYDLFFSVDLSERTVIIVKVRWGTKGLRKKGKEQMSC